MKQPVSAVPGTPSPHHLSGAACGEFLEHTQKLLVSNLSRASSSEELAPKDTGIRKLHIKKFPVIVSTNHILRKQSLLLLVWVYQSVLSVQSVLRKGCVEVSVHLPLGKHLAAGGRLKVSQVLPQSSQYCSFWLSCFLPSKPCY